MGECAQLGQCASGEDVGSESQRVWALERSWKVVSGAGAVRQASEGLVASCELQEEVLVQLLPAGPLPR